MRTAHAMARNTSRPVRSLRIWSAFVSHSLARPVRQALVGSPRESVEDELRRVEREFEDARSMRHARRLVAKALGLEQ